ncbi:dTMP kinase [Campylobacter sp. VBCF_06 NA8]|uniref:dTMP kinase n=1 Tax=Campylobacter sp. VBCF_06 NA8 TaxID=2983822 RepID=UPI0022E9B79B|nr:dTMP kinase [Campylobacter sp. VBCF_06 NA8]MDA3046502.1 dTMP kinase [Campylobacter sp. VBCF_06 NA8]
MFVAFEGIDGVGKSTQISRLAEIYPGAIVTKEPGATRFGEILRSIILNENFKFNGDNHINLGQICGSISKTAEMFLFLSDRAEHHEKVVLPNSHNLILSDRSFISGIAYALANDENAKFDELVMLNKIALGGEIYGKFVFFEISKDDLIARLNTRAGYDKIELRGAEYLLRVQEKIKFTLQKLKLNFLIVNANDDIDKITKKIKEFIDD